MGAIRVVSRKIKTSEGKDNRLALDIVSLDGTVGHVIAEVLEVEPRYRLGPLKIGEKRVTLDRRDVALFPDNGKTLEVDGREFVKLTLRKAINKVY